MESLKTDQHNTKCSFLIFRCNQDFPTHKWIDSFTQLDVFIGLRDYIGEEAFMTFDVHDDGRLTFTHIETNLFSFCWHK